jgi:hypothetical protein
VLGFTRDLATLEESITLLKTEGLRRRSSLSPILTFIGYTSFAVLGEMAMRSRRWYLLRGLLQLAVISSHDQTFAAKRRRSSVNIGTHGVFTQEEKEKKRGGKRLEGVTHLDKLTDRRPFACWKRVAFDGLLPCFLNPQERRSGLIQRWFERCLLANCGDVRVCVCVCVYVCVSVCLCVWVYASA